MTGATVCQDSEFMTVCVFGLWHLGSVTAACVAERFDTIAIDGDANVVRGLKEGKAPVFEPGLEDLIRAGLSSGRLRFSNDIRDVRDAEIVWVTCDTPVNENDEADVEYVESRIESLFPYLRGDAIVLISSQLPVGTTARLELLYRADRKDGNARFAYSPENLRLGKALDVFRNPGRIVAGVREARDRERLNGFLGTFCENIVWMSVESAEMTKHALNSFLANSVVFMNEIAAICERTGADAKQVEQGLKTDERIGARAYLSPGAAFAGGTLARDVAFLANRSAQDGIRAPLIASISQSNEFHKAWPRRKLESMLGSLNGKRIAVLGLTYKPGTDTLRRSQAVELACWLLAQGASVFAFDPAVRSVPDEPRINPRNSAREALESADAVVIATEWPVFRELRRDDFLSAMRAPVVLDPNRFLEGHVDLSSPIRYAAVGMPAEKP